MANEFTTWRENKVRAGEFIYLYSVKQLLPGAPITVPNGWTVTDGTRYAGQGIFYSELQRINIPANAAPGTYHLTFTDLTSTDRAFDVVVAPPFIKNNPVHLPYGCTADDMMYAINVCHSNYLYLPPGLTTLETDVFVSDPTWDVYIDGNCGASTLTKLPNSGGDSNRFFNLAQGLGTVNLIGVNLVGNSYDDLVYQGYPTSSRRLDVRNCTVSNVQLFSQAIGDELNNPGAMLIEQTQFLDYSGTGLGCARQLLLNNRFTGRGERGQHQCWNFGNSNCLNLGSEFRETNRGFVNQGTVQNCLFLGARLHGVGRRGEYDGGECFLVEGANNTNSQCFDNLILNMHVYGATGPGISIYGNDHHDMIFDDIKLGCEGASIYIAQLQAGTYLPIQNIKMTRVECDGSVIVTGDVRNCSVDGTRREFPLSAGNQPPWTGRPAGAPNAYPRTPIIDDRSSQSGGGGNKWLISLSQPRNTHTVTVDAVGKPVIGPENNINAI